MPTARSILPDRFEDGRHLAIENGAQAAGFALSRGFAAGRPGDILLTWTRHRGSKEAQCERFEAEGGTVIVCEEPHVKGRPPGLDGRLYCLTPHDHQVGPWRAGGPERWASFGLEIKPWRHGSELVVREQRGIGSSRMRSPDNWHGTMAATLRRRWGDRYHVRVRGHPKIAKRLGLEAPTLADDLHNAAALVTWASSDGTEALLLGVPVVYCAPDFMAAAAAHQSTEAALEAALPDRLPAFERLAWCHWTLAELESGAALAHTLGL